MSICIPSSNVSLRDPNIRPRMTIPLVQKLVRTAQNPDLNSIGLNYAPNFLLQHQFLASLILLLPNENRLKILPTVAAIMNSEHHKHKFCKMLL